MSVAAPQQAVQSTISWAAVLFDLDGTLVDTQQLHEAAYTAALGSVGLPLEPAVYRASHGLRFDRAIDVLLGGRDAGLPLDELHGRKAAAFSQLVDLGRLTLLPAAGLVPILRGRVPIALVTSASQHTVTIILRRLSWEDTFDVIVHGDEQIEAKPSPAPYLDAARRLGVASHRCLVFEDSDLGVSAARAAGMAVIDVRNSTVP